MLKLIRLVTLAGTLSLSAIGADITQCGTQITQPGIYRLTRNLSCGNVEAITVRADRVTIYLQGYGIRSNIDQPIARGIRILDANRVSVHGPGRFENLRAGVVAVRSGFVTLRNLTFSDNLWGAIISEVNRLSMYENDFNHPLGYAVHLYASTRAILRDNFFSGSSGPILSSRLALSMFRSERVSLYDNTFNDFDRAIVVNRSPRTFLYNNIIRRSGVGVQVSDSERSSLSRGEFVDNDCDLQVFGTPVRTSGVSLNQCR